MLYTIVAFKFSLFIFLLALHFRLDMLQWLHISKYFQFELSVS